MKLFYSSAFCGGDPGEKATRKGEVLNLNCYYDVLTYI